VNIRLATLRVCENCSPLDPKRTPAAWKWQLPGDSRGC